MVNTENKMSKIADKQKEVIDEDIHLIMQKVNKISKIEIV